MYPGIVIQNNDPERAGRVKVFVPGITNTVYENWNQVQTDKEISFVDGDLNPILSELRDSLPWATNACSSFGGGTSRLSAGTSSTNLSRSSGVFSIPNVGAHVFLFFVAGDINSPVVFAINHGASEWSGEVGDGYPQTYENSGGGNYTNKHLINTNKHSIELIDTDGTEEIRIYSAKNMNTVIVDDNTLTIGGAWDVHVGDTVTIYTKKVEVFEGDVYVVDGDVIAGTISLKNHVHTQNAGDDFGAGGITTPPNA